MRLKKIKICGFRRLEDVAVEFDGLSVLIGPNGIGKSSFLDVLSLLAEAMKGKLAEGMGGRGGIARLLSRFTAPRLTFRLESEPVPWPKSNGQSPLVYEVELVPSGQGYAIASEHLTQLRDQPGGPFRYIQRSLNEIRFFDLATSKLELPTWSVDLNELALAQVPRSYPDPESFRSSLAMTRAYSPILLDERSALRLPQTARPGVAFPAPSGDDLLSALYDLRATFPDSFERLTDAIQAGFPGFERLDFAIVGAGQFALTWKERGLNGPLYANELSAGTLRFLHLATMLLSPQSPPILLLDEPELSFHPDLLRIFAELLDEASDRTQLIVATHAAPLVKCLKPEQVVVAQRSEAGTALTRGDELHLDNWLKNYTLDELWQMNVIEANK